MSYEPKSNLGKMLRVIVEEVGAMQPQAFAKVYVDDALREADAASEESAALRTIARLTAPSSPGETAAEEKASPAGEGDKDRKAKHFANCVRCGRIIDTRENEDGGDEFGCELSDGRWTCSEECWEAIAGPAVPAGEAEASGGWRDVSAEVCEACGHPRGVHDRNGGECLHRLGRDGMCPCEQFVPSAPAIAVPPEAQKEAPPKRNPLSAVIECIATAGENERPAMIHASDCRALLPLLRAASPARDGLAEKIKAIEPPDYESLGYDGRVSTQKVAAWRAALESAAALADAENKKGEA